MTFAISLCVFWALTPWIALVVLVAEDRDALRAMLGRLLEALGWEVTAVACADSAMEAVRRNGLPDLLIGQVMRGPDGRLRVLLAADYRRLRYIRVLRPQPSESVEPARDLLGPRLPPLVAIEPSLTGE